MLIIIMQSVVVLSVTNKPIIMSVVMLNVIYAVIIYACYYECHLC